MLMHILAYVGLSLLSIILLGIIEYVEDEGPSNPSHTLTTGGLIQCIIASIIAGWALAPIAFLVWAFIVAGRTEGKILFGGKQANNIEKLERFGKGRLYFYVNAHGEVEEESDIRMDCDTKRFDCGNYFHTKDKATNSALYKAYNKK